MTLGELIRNLEQVNPNKICKRGFKNPHSYRGYYDNLAFESAQNISVGSMLSDARSALERSFEGYKGGDYTMSRNTLVWLAQWGDTTGAELDAGQLGWLIFS